MPILLFVKCEITSLFPVKSNKYSPPPPPAYYASSIVVHIVALVCRLSLHTLSRMHSRRGGGKYLLLFTGNKLVISDFTNNKIGISAPKKFSNVFGNLYMLYIQSTALYDSPQPASILLSIRKCREQQNTSPRFHLNLPAKRNRVNSTYCTEFGILSV